MNDCPNADVRDLLPDLVHDRLDPETRAGVEAHVASCADCRAELTLLRDVHAVRRTPRVDVGAVAAAIPAYRAPVRRSWVGWRTAAAITVLVVGGSSVALIDRGVAPIVDTTSVAVTGVPNRADSVAMPVVPTQVVASDTRQAPDRAVAGGSVHAGVRAPVTAPAIPAPAVITKEPAARELAMGGGSLNDLSNGELTSLLRDIEALDAVPSVDVDNTPVAPIAPDTPRRRAP